jgi:putative hydrolase of the HAD superfamily
VKRKALIFDFDGLILDTETTRFRAWQAIYREHGVELNDVAWKKGVGVYPGFNPRTDLEQTLGRILDWQALDPGYRKRELAIVDQQPLLPGVVGILRQAPRHDFVVGLASSSSADWVGRWLAKHDLIQHFACVMTGDKVKRVKPHPEIYLQALAALDADAAHSIAFEDSLSGITSAKGAGLKVYAVPNDFTRGHDLSQADVVLQTLEDFVFPGETK